MASAVRVQTGIGKPRHRRPKAGVMDRHRRRRGPEMVSRIERIGEKCLRTEVFVSLCARTVATTAGSAIRVRNHFREEMSEKVSDTFFLPFPIRLPPLA